jgi:hypothetical protein
LRRLFLIGAFGLLLLAAHALTTAISAADAQPITPRTSDPLGAAAPPVFLPYIVGHEATAPLPVGFLETFDGTPANPTPWHTARWDITVHSRDALEAGTVNAMQAGHGPNCEPPPQTHEMDTVQGAVFNCKDHMMTALNESGYGVIYLTPDTLADFSAGAAIIQFDVSTLRNSHRDWLDVWITPYEENLQLPLQTFYPDLNGPPRHAIHIFMDSFNGETPFRAEVYDDFEATAVDGNWWTGYESFLTPSATRRDTFQLIVTKNHLKFGMPAYDFWWIDEDMPELDWTEGVVQLGHHSYNPEKDCNFDGTCGANTWHWDNVSITPAVPFTIIEANQRFATASTSGQVSLMAPAPADAHLRFAGLGENLEVSFNGGTTWQAAQLQDQVESIDGHAQSYWMPIPAGITQVRFRGDDWWGGEWQVRDITVWAPPSE